MSDELFINIKYGDLFFVHITFQVLFLKWFKIEKYKVFFKKELNGYSNYYYLKIRFYIFFVLKIIFGKWHLGK